MNKLFIAAVMLTLIDLPAISAYAADSHESHHAVAEAQKSYAVKGEVVAIDQAAGKLKLKHEAIPELGWSAMTMDFSVAGKNLLDGIKAGDKVNFELIKDQSSGQYMIRALRAGK